MMSPYGYPVIPSHSSFPCIFPRDIFLCLPLITINYARYLVAEDITLPSRLYWSDCVCSEMLHTGKFSSISMSCSSQVTGLCASFAPDLHSVEWKHVLPCTNTSLVYNLKYCLRNVLMSLVAFSLITQLKFTKQCKTIYYLNEDVTTSKLILTSGNIN
jgi:hypothetical protein